MTKKGAFMLTTADHWVELEADPLARFDLDHDEAVEAAGYYEWGRLSKKDFTPLWLEIYRRKEGLDSVPEYMVVICNSGFWDVVYAESTPAMMNMKARWAPAIQAAAVTELLGELEDDTTYSTFANLVRQALSRN
ncbi:MULTISPECIES: hypothetical protein [Streptomyces]|uniref:hypothetical protein n=1 Tax=Streptomyces TaxID=1883 RepID=UPI0023DD5C70|nr:hypothetical protein [Streptomyces sp. FXJ1.172]WEP00667.1 hypothetical protein A6P39_043935 [Streptomyces sp. FXJ1.172]